MLHFLSFFPFLVISAFAFYIPGYVIMEFVRFKLNGFSLQVMRFVSGIVFFLIVAYLFAWIRIPYAHFLLLLITGLYFFYIKKKSFSFKGVDRVSISIIVMGSIMATSLTATSGILTNHGWQYIGANAADGLVHIARIKNFLHDFPPTHPGLAGVEFRGYHYFYDFLLSRFALLFKFSAEDLYFRHFPILITSLYGCTIFLLLTRITKSKLAQRLGIFFAYFGLSFNVVVKQFDSLYGPMLVDPLWLIHDPSIVFSMFIFISGLFLLTSLKTIKQAVLLGIFFGGLAQIKIYTGILGVVAVVVYSGYFVVRFRKLPGYIIVLNIVTAAVTVITFFPNNFGAGSLIFAPMLLYSNFIQQHSFSQWNWEIKRVIFAENNNYLRIILLYLQAALLYWVLTLGIRIILLFGGLRLFRRKFWLGEYNILLTSIIVTCVIIPSFFIQSISVFDISQFIWILGALISIPLAIVLSDLYKRKKRIGKSIIVLFLLYSVIGNVILLKEHYVPHEQYITSINEAEAYMKIQNNISTEENVLVVPDKTIKGFTPYPPSMVAALIGRNIYLEEQIITYPHPEIYKERRDNVDKVYTSISACNIQRLKKIMNEIQIENMILMFDSPCLATQSATFRVITNSERAQFYQVK